jgi:hypothetical protein
MGNIILRRCDCFVKMIIFASLKRRRIWKKKNRNSLNNKQNEMRNTEERERLDPLNYYLFMKCMSETGDAGATRNRIQVQPATESRSATQQKRQSRNSVISWTDRLFTSEIMYYKN